MLFDFAVEHLLPEDEARQITEPYWDDLARVWTSSWQAWGNLDEEHRARLMETPFVPSITLFGFAQSFAKEIFSGRETEGIVQCHELQVFGFYIQDKVLIRFNNFGADFIVRNSQSGTDRKEQYFLQEPIAGLNNDATRLTVGAVPNAAKTDLHAVVISCQVGDSRYYCFRIDDADGAVVAGPSAVEPPQPNDVSEKTSKRKPR